MPVLKSDVWHTPSSGGPRRRCLVSLSTEREFKVVPVGPRNTRGEVAAPLIKVTGFRKAVLGSRFVHEGGVGVSGSVKDNRWFYFVLEVDDENVIFCTNKQQEAKKWEDFLKEPIQVSESPVAPHGAMQQEIVSLTTQLEEAKQTISELTNKLQIARETPQAEPYQPSQNPVTASSPVSSSKYYIEISDLQSKLALRGEALKQVEFERLTESERFKAQLQRLREKLGLPGICPECHLHEAMLHEKTDELAAVDMELKRVTAENENMKKAVMKHAAQRAGLEKRFESLVRECRASADDEDGAKQVVAGLEKERDTLRDALKKAEEEVRSAFSATPAETPQAAIYAEAQARSLIAQNWQSSCSKCCSTAAAVLTRLKLSRHDPTPDYATLQSHLEHGTDYYMFDPSFWHPHSDNGVPTTYHTPPPRTQSTTTYVLTSDHPIEACFIPDPTITIRTIHRGEFITIPSGYDVSEGGAFNVPVEIRGYINKVEGVSPGVHHGPIVVTLQNSTTLLDLPHTAQYEVVEVLKSKAEVRATVDSRITVPCDALQLITGEGWVVVGHEGVQLSLECRKDSEAVGKVASGSWVDVAERRGNRVRIVGPRAAGWASVTNYSGVVLLERSTASRHAELHQFQKKNLNTNLQQSIDFLQSEKVELEATILHTTQDHANALKTAEIKINTLEATVTNLESSIKESAADASRLSEAARQAEARLSDAQAMNENILVELSQKSEELDALQQSSAEAKKLSEISHELEEKDYVIDKIQKEYDMKTEENSLLQSELLAARAALVKAKEAYSAHFTALSEELENAQGKAQSLNEHKKRHETLLSTATRQATSLNLLETEHTTLTRQHSNLRDEVAALRSEREDHLTHLRGLTEDNETLQESSTGLEKDVQNTRDQVRLITKELEEKSERLIDAEDNLTALTAQLQQAHQMKEDDDGVITNLRNQVAALGAVAEETSELKRLYEEATMQLDEAIQEITNFREELAASESLSGQRQSEADDLKTQMREAEIEYAQELQGLRDQQKAVVDSCLAQLNSQILDMREECTHTKALLSEKAEELRSLNKTNDEQTVMLHHAEERVTGLEEDLAERVQKQEVQVLSSQQELDESRVECDKLKAEVDTQKLTLQETEGKLKAMHDEIKAFKNAAAQHTADLSRQLGKKLEETAALRLLLAASDEQHVTVLETLEGEWHEQLLEEHETKEEITNALLASEQCVVALTQQLGERVQEAGALTRGNDEQAAQLREAKAAASDLQEEKNRLYAQLEEAGSENAALAKEANELKEQAAGHSKQSEASERYVAEMQSQLLGLRGDGTRAQTILREKCDQLEQALQDKQKLKVKVLSLCTELESTQEDLASAVAQAASLKEAMTELVAAEAGHVAEKEALTEAFEEKQLQASEATGSRTAAIRQQLDAKTAEVEVLRSAVEAKNQDLLEAKGEATLLTDEVEAMKGAAAQHAAELGRQLGKKVEEVISLQKYIDASERQHKEMLAVLDRERVEQLQEAHETKKEVTAALSESEKCVSSLTRQLDVLKGDVGSAKAELAGKAAEAGALQAKVEELTAAEVTKRVELRGEMDLKVAQLEAERKEAVRAHGDMGVERSKLQDEVDRLHGVVEQRDEAARSLTRRASELGRAKEQLVISGDVVGKLRGQVKELSEKNQKQGKQLDDATQELTRHLLKEDKMATSLHFNEELVMRLQYEGTRRDAELDLLKQTHERLREEYAAKAEKYEKKMNEVKKKAAVREGEGKAREAVVAELRGRIVELEVGKEDEVRRLEEWSAQQACEVAVGYERVWSRRNSLTAASEENSFTAASSVATDVDSTNLERRADIAETAEWKIREENDSLRQTLTTVTQKYKHLKKKYAAAIGKAPVQTRGGGGDDKQGLKSATLREKAAGFENKYLTTKQKQRSSSQPAGSGRTKGSAVMNVPAKTPGENLLDDSISV